MIYSITDMVKLLIFVRSMIGKSSFKAVVISSFLAAALVFNSVSASADFRLDSTVQGGTLQFVPLSSVAFEAIGTAYVTRAALGALGIELGVSLLDLAPDDIVNALWNGSPSTLPPAFTYSQNLVQYFSRETIKIRPDTVTIDGVEYSDVWLPHDCANKFRTNAFDFVTRYNISSESVGSYVSGVGRAGDTLFYDVNGLVRSQNYVFNNAGQGSAASGWRIATGIDGGYRFTIDQYSNNTYWGSVPSMFSRGTNYSAYLSFTSDGVYDNYTLTCDGVSTTHSTVIGTGPYHAEPFDFTWVASTIPSTPLPLSYGLRTRLPSTYVKDLPQILDPESSTYADDLASLISGLESAASDDTLVDPAFEEWDTPVPPASNTIADEPYSSLSGSLSGIQSIISSISSSVSGIAESIVGADSTFFGNIVSALAIPFEPVFAVFRSGVGIWRYVVSWVGTISAPFTWSLSALGSAGSYFLSPIYAAAAAAVVLAVYKKFGR